MKSLLAAAAASLALAASGTAAELAARDDVAEFYLGSAASGARPAALAQHDPVA